jgi:transcriptional regulator of arginine metabolism
MHSAVYPRAMKRRNQRHNLIRQLVQEQRVPSQDALLSLLADRGVRCTQATLSRDLRLLGIHREVDNEGPRYHLDGKRQYLAALQKVVGMEILSVHDNGSMVVIRTLTGRAQGVAAFLDSQPDADILGTLAGDDTVFVAPRSTEAISSLVTRIRGLCSGPNASSDALTALENGR